MKPSVVIAAFVGLTLASAPLGSASNRQAASMAKASSMTYKHDNAAIRQALKRLDLTSLGSVNALVDTGFSMASDMRTHKQLLASTKASTKVGGTGRSLLLRGLTALAASGDYMVRYGRALGSGAPLSVLQIDSDGYRIKGREGETLARRGAALLGVSFG